MPLSFRFRLFASGAAALLGAAMLSGCGGGSGSGAILGGSQDPDPVIVDVAIAYVQRPLETAGTGSAAATNPRDPARFRPGADLRVRDRASPSAAERSITADLFPGGADGLPAPYDVRDLSTSYDGSQLLFALRAPQIPGAAASDQPTWDIWRYDHVTGTATRVIQSDTVAAAGQDLAPRFLPDGRILFTSTRQRQARAVLLDEGKPQFTAQDESRLRPAYNLHVMEADGSEIHQISFNPSGDFYPAVTGDGRIVFSRWDNVGSTDRISLYSAEPDGRSLQLLYGVHSRDSGPDGSRIEFVQAEELPDGRLQVLLQPSGESSRQSLLPVAIDVANYIDNTQPTFAAAGLSGPAQEPLFSGDLALGDENVGLQGRYAAAAPLFDGSGRFLVAWSQCRLLDTHSGSPARIIPCTMGDPNDPRYEEAPPLYGLWMRNPRDDTQQPIVPGREGIAITDVAVLESRVLPAIRFDGTPGFDIDGDLAAAGAGVIHIRSVYDFDGQATVSIDTMRDPLQTPAAQRPARFLRLVKAVSLPDRDLRNLPGTAFGRSQAQLMREILGYAMIEPDGSVMVQVPANVAFWPEVLDADGRRIGPRHNNWLHVRPGEVLHCNGCHTPASTLPHGRLDAEAPSANPGAPIDGSPFPNTNPALFADAGETMAEVRARLFGIPPPDVDLVFVDPWSDPALRDPDPPFAHRYASLQTPPPSDPGCAIQWSANCRITINYEQHIHPLWSVEREVMDDDGFTVLADHTCTACHSPEDQDGLARVPAAQLDLTDGPSPIQPAHLHSYRELLFPDVQRVVEDGVLVVELVQALDANGQPRFQTDGNGDLLLDEDGMPIPILVTIPVQPSLSVTGARASPRFFSRFASGASHEGYLSPAELKLISEWIDVGGQYFNDPFAVPQ